MLFPASPLLLDATKTEKMASFAREAQLDRLQRQLSPARKFEWQGNVRRLLHRCGHMLMTFGETLDRLGTLPA